MTMGEFLYAVTEQIRCKKAREPIGEELKNHILDQARDYEQSGLEKEEALEKAVAEMGDPVEIGAAMDRIHRPKMSWSVMILVGVISICSIILHAVLRKYSAEPDMGNYYLKTQIRYTIIGYLIMLGICRLDYSFLGKKSRLTAIFFLAFMIGGTLFLGRQYHGVTRYINLGGGLPDINVCIGMWLFVPIYAAVLYGYRGQGYDVLWKLFLWAAVPVLFVWMIPSLFTACVLGLSFVILFSVAVWKGWYHIRKKAVLCVLWSVILGVPLLLAGMAFLNNGESRLLAVYQIQRLQAFLSNDPNYNYLGNMAQSIIQNSYLVGRNEENLIHAANALPGYNSDYIFVSLIAAYGTLAGILAAMLFIWMIGKIFRISFGQKNQLGMIIGCGCGVIFLIQTVLCILENLNLFPATSVILPFVSCGGGEIVTSYILLGLVLSIYRYQNILPEKYAGKMRKELCGSEKEIA